MMCLRIENFVREFSLCPICNSQSVAFSSTFFYEIFKNGFPGHRERFFLDGLYEEILFREKEVQVSKGFFSEPHYFLGTKLSQVWSS